MMKLCRTALLVCLCLLSLAGCGEVEVPEVVDAPTIAVDKEGVVRVWQVGEFDKTYYNVAELANMASEEAAQYNTSQGKEAVAVEKAETLEGNSSKVVVAYRFDNWQSCKDFCEAEFFFGTVKEAAVNGIDTDPDMKSAKDGSALGAALLGQSEGEYLLVTDMKANIYCSRKVVYISQGAEVNEDGSIKPPEEDGLVYILMK